MTFSHSLHTVTTHQDFHSRHESHPNPHKSSRSAPNFTSRLKSDSADYDILWVFTSRYFWMQQTGVKYQVLPLIHLLNSDIKCTRLRISGPFRRSENCRWRVLWVSCSQRKSQTWSLQHTVCPSTLLSGKCRCLRASHPDSQAAFPAAKLSSANANCIVYMYFNIFKGCKGYGFTEILHFFSCLAIKRPKITINWSY